MGLRESRKRRSWWFLEARKKKLAAEIANGRLAMMAIIGMFFQNGLTGEPRVIS